jgi:hypothetical protein
MMVTNVREQDRWVAPRPGMTHTRASLHFESFESFYSQMRARPRAYVRVEDKTAKTARLRTAKNWASQAAASDQQAREPAGHQSC